MNIATARVLKIELAHGAKQAIVTLGLLPQHPDIQPSGEHFELHTSRHFANGLRLGSAFALTLTPID